MVSEIVELHFQMMLFTWVKYIWKSYVCYRQEQVCINTVNVPSELDGFMDQKLFDKTRLYQLDLCRSARAKLTVDVMVFTFFLYSNFYAKLWLYCQSISIFSTEIGMSCMWIFLLNTTLDVIDLPIVTYNVFVLNEKYGFNKQTAAFFIKDQLLQFVTKQLLCLPAGIVSVLIVDYGGQLYYIWLFFILSAALIGFVVFAPVYILPLVDKFTPLPEGPLKTKIEKLASEVDYQAENIYLVDSSKQSSRSNAYAASFSQYNRIVIYDNLLAEDSTYTDEEILAILCHELGHWKYNHIIELLTLKEIQLLMICTVVYKFVHLCTLYRAIEFPPNLKPTIIGLFVIFKYCFIPYGMFCNFVRKFVSRTLEYEADEFAAKLGYSDHLQTALVHLQNDNLLFPVLDPLFSVSYLSHPSILERIDRLKIYK